MMKNNKKNNKDEQFRIVKKLFHSIDNDRKQALDIIGEINKTLHYIDVETNPDAYAKTSTSQIKAIEALQKSTDQMINIFSTYIKNDVFEQEEIGEDFYEKIYSNEEVEIEPEINKENE